MENVEQGDISVFVCNRFRFLFLIIEASPSLFRTEILLVAHKIY